MSDDELVYEKHGLLDDYNKLKAYVNKYNTFVWSSYINRYSKTNEKVKNLKLNIINAKKLIRTAGIGYVAWGVYDTEIEKLLKTFEDLSFITSDSPPIAKSEPNSHSEYRRASVTSLQNLVNKYKSDAWQDYLKKYVHVKPEATNLQTILDDANKILSNKNLFSDNKILKDIKTISKKFLASKFDKMSSPPKHTPPRKMINNKLFTKKEDEWPEIWDINGTVQLFSVNNLTLFNTQTLDIYVTPNDHFTINFDKFNIKYNGKFNEGNVNRNYDYDTYTASLYAAYVTTYLSGISTQHFEYKQTVPKVITSIARYHFLYHMKRFLYDPKRLKSYIIPLTEKLINGIRPKRKIWAEKTEDFSKLKKFRDKYPADSVRIIKHEIIKPESGLGIGFSKVRFKLHTGWDNGPNYTENYKLFVAKKSNGLTKTGALLMLESIESYVYCVLGAQAQTRSPIVGIPGQSLRTQLIFKKLVTDTVVADNIVLLKNNMEKAIISTNVILNLAMFPGLPLIPSRLIILNKIIKGYNNIEKVATKSHGFGYGANINFQGVPDKKTMQNVGREDDLKPIDESDDEDKDVGSKYKQPVETQSHEISDNPDLGNSLYLSGIAGIVTYVALSGIL